MPWTKRLAAALWPQPWAETLGSGPEVLRGPKRGREGGLGPKTALARGPREPTPRKNHSPFLVASMARGASAHTTTERAGSGRGPRGRPALPHSEESPVVGDCSPERAILDSADLWKQFLQMLLYSFASGSEPPQYLPIK